MLLLQFACHNLSDSGLAEDAKQESSQNLQRTADGCCKLTVAGSQGGPAYMQIHLDYEKLQ